MSPRAKVTTVVLVAWALLGWWLRGRDTLALGGSDVTGLHTWLGEARDRLDAARETSWVLRDGLGTLTSALDATVMRLRETVSLAPAGRPVPEVGWLGVVACLTWVSYALAGWRSALLGAGTLVLVGLLGYWTEALDTLVVTLLSVLVCVLVGVPLGVWSGRDRRVAAVLNPVLDIAQTLPAFAYLAPLALLLGIGASAWVVITVVFALPVLVRVTALAVARVPRPAPEAAESFGATRWQALRLVRLPLARPTMLVGVNQATMAALAMATVVALVNAPGLGGPVLAALRTLDVGTAFVSGLAIVLLAIWLDRTTTAAGELPRRRALAGERARRGRRIALVVGGVAALVCVWLSRTYLGLARFPESPDLGGPLADAVGSATDAVVGVLEPVTAALRDAVSAWLLDPLQSVLAESPWWLSAAAILTLAGVLGGWQACGWAVGCVGVVLGTGLWHDAMITLAATVVATVVVVGLAVVLGVLMARRPRVDRGLRPVLDALQTIPAFVYLVPALALFGPTRFTAVLAAVAYAVPVAAKLVADGVRAVPRASVEAAVSLGATSWQVVTRVQLPTAWAALVLAANQGLLFVLSMVVVGGLVGGGGLGYLVVAGFSQGTLFGKGLAAGVAITALGVLLDRTARYGAMPVRRPMLARPTRQRGA